MASPAFGFSWGRRSSSASRSAQETAQLPSVLGSGCGASFQRNVEARAASPAVGSLGHREPIRSFIQGSFRDNTAPVDNAQYAQSVRDDTAELANYFLSDNSTGETPSFLNRRRAYSSHSVPGRVAPPELEPEGSLHTVDPSEDTIEEVSEPASPDEISEVRDDDGPSMLSNMLKRSPPQSVLGSPGSQRADNNMTVFAEDESEVSSTAEARSHVGGDERAPLLGRSPHGNRRSYRSAREADIESQTAPRKRPWFGLVSKAKAAAAAHYVRVATHPRSWHPRATLWSAGEALVAPLGAVTVGLLLNILDALSYGMILFPLGDPIFAHLGPAGIAIFFVSTIISQLVFSTGSIFKGAVGSELIEVVPFFHGMAFTIKNEIGEQNPDAVIATTITAYALSSIMTGVFFYSMGKFKIGYLVGFIPRHILLGCIGGVGWFLIATGFEVSARLDDGIRYNFDTVRRLTQPEVVWLWVIPFVLSLVLFYGKSKITSRYFLPAFIITIPAVFYFFNLSLDSLDTETLRDGGWIFKSPPSDEPWWYFYTLYKFDLVEWGAIANVIPNMFALTFFGLLHVPINVPALALQTGEDHANLDHELKLHGYSNILSGMCGSIQNYLVYANSQLFMRSGGNSRIAGYELAAFSFAVMTIGPLAIGYIPVMMVGVLIFYLGYELLIEAVWESREKLKPVELLTVIVIVVIMGVWDFVYGILIGILLTCALLVIQTSRVPAVRATYSGDVVGSTVRRNPSQQHYLQQARHQTYVVMLAGYLFFGTVVSVEENIRAMITDEAFARRPLRFVVLDLRRVTDIDYSSGVAFNTIARLLSGKGIQLVISGVDSKGNLARNLRASGLGGDDSEEGVVMMPDLNSAIESCDNEYLRTFYASQEALKGRSPPAAVGLDVPKTKADLAPSLELAASPRRSHLHEAAQKSLDQLNLVRNARRWQSFKEPLRLLLQIFQEVSDRNEDFWFRAAKFFARRELAAGTVLFRRGDAPAAFYLLESGILRADYHFPQGFFSESIVAGTTCGELPFFSDTPRTATVTAEQNSAVWVLDRDSWRTMQREEPEVAQEILQISLKLTTERMSVITSYVLTMAG